ncbi:MAG: type VI secretion system accessory protein TagJ [Gammaproteobacteria bacterium]
MGAQEALQAGDLDQALADLQQQVRKEPAVARHRIFLFQLQAVRGEWQKALTQLNVLRDMDASTLPMAQTYQEAIQCEAIRADVFAGKRSPLIFGDPEHWLALLVEALHPDAAGHYAQAADLRGQALEQTPAISGTIDGAEFAWIADADPRLGPVLEAIVNGRYYWVPFQRIAKLELEAPADLRDMVWLPAQFTWSNGGQTVGLIPSRYPGSAQSTDNAIRLARKTDWQTVGEVAQYGLGQRLLATDVDDYALLDTRLIELNTIQDSTEKSAKSTEPDG